MSDNVYTFKGDFAAYVAEADRAAPIELDLGEGNILRLPIPSRRQFVDYWKVVSNETDLPTEAADGEVYSPYAVAEWEALLGKKNATAVLKHFEDRPFTQLDAFMDFVRKLWFGKGADDVEGK